MPSCSYRPEFPVLTNATYKLRFFKAMRSRTPSHRTYAHSTLLKSSCRALIFFLVRLPTPWKKKYDAPVILAVAFRFHAWYSGVPQYSYAQYMSWSFKSVVEVQIASWTWSNPDSRSPTIQCRRCFLLPAELCIFEAKWSGSRRPRQWQMFPRDTFFFLKKKSAKRIRIVLWLMPSHRGGFVNVKQYYYCDKKLIQESLATRFRDVCISPLNRKYCAVHHLLVHHCFWEAGKLNWFKTFPDNSSCHR